MRIVTGFKRCYVIKKFYISLHRYQVEKESPKYEYHENRKKKLGLIPTYSEEFIRYIPLMKC